MEYEYKKKNNKFGVVFWVAVIFIAVVTYIVVTDPDAKFSFNTNFLNKTFNKTLNKNKGDEKADKTDNNFKGEDANLISKTKSEYNQNEIAEVGGVKYQVLNVKRVQPSKYDPIKAGNEYVIISIKIKNDSSEKIRYSPFNWKMENSKKQEADTKYSYDKTNDALETGTLLPGGEVTGSISFSEPKNDNGLKLNYYKDGGSDKLPDLKISLK